MNVVETFLSATVDTTFCQKCMDSHAKGAVCIADLESAVIEAAIKWQEWYDMRATVVSPDAVSTLSHTVKALIAARTTP